MRSSSRPKKASWRVLLLLPAAIRGCLPRRCCCLWQHDAQRRASHGDVARVQDATAGGACWSLQGQLPAKKGKREPQSSSDLLCVSVAGKCTTCSQSGWLSCSLSSISNALIAPSVASAPCPPLPHQLHAGATETVGVAFDFVRKALSTSQQHPQDEEVTWIRSNEASMICGLQPEPWGRRRLHMDMHPPACTHKHTLAASGIQGGQLQAPWPACCHSNNCILQHAGLRCPPGARQ